MSSIKENIKDSSLFRKIYIIDLFFCNISFLQIPAYVFLVFLFIWGVYLTVHNQKTNNTYFKLRFGLWIGAFLACSVIAILFNFSVTIAFSVVMLLHTLICFFIFYGMHTEPNLDFKDELYTIAKIIVYISTIANIIGIICLMVGVRFVWYSVNFIIFENRFTGIYINPNLLGFSAVVAIVCSHILYKPDFMEAVLQPRVSKIWIISCVATNLFSLMLCDSNGSTVLLLGYAIMYVAYIFFSDKSEILKQKRISKSKITLKIISLLLVGIFLIGSALMMRSICQAGFSTLVSKTSSFISVIANDYSDTDNNLIDNPELDKDDITFNHENKNLDSGRFKLWNESFVLFKKSPVIGISYGNIVYYSQKYGNKVLDYTVHHNDLHNGYLTILTSTGVIGFILFAIFGFRFLKHAAQHLFLRKRTYRNDVYPCLFSFIFAYLLFAFIEKAMLYDISFMVMWLWLFMGYTSCYIARHERTLKTKYVLNKKLITRNML